MKKLLFVDLTICSLWMLCVFGGRGSWTQPLFVISVLSVLIRLVVSFSFYYQEKRSWLPLGVFAMLMTSLVYEKGMSIGVIAKYFFFLTGWEYNKEVGIALTMCMGLWIFVAPFIYYLTFWWKCKRTELTWKELLGGVLWHDRLTKTCSAILAVMLMTFLTGISMTPHLCQVMCFTAVPLTYWLLCHYLRVKSECLWVLIISMAIFWYGQSYAGLWRASLLMLSFALVAYVGILLYKNTRYIMLAFCSVLYLGILLPSFSIGYNQYACIDYARSGFAYLTPFRGIIYVTDSTGGLYGLRDRYGLLITPEYEYIGSGTNSPCRWSYEYAMQKDGYTRYYDVLNNEFINEPDIVGDLQLRVKEIIERYFADNGSEYDDRGQIKVTDLQNGKTIADVRVSMYGNPLLNYCPEHYLADDSVEVTSGNFFRNNSVWTSDITMKHSLSYAIHVPDSMTARYRIYVRLATERTPSDSTMIGIARQVAALKELRQ